MQNPQAGDKLIRIVFFTLVLSVMNGTMFNVALPTIAGEFTLSASQVSWVVTAFVITYAIGAVTYGKLADKYRLKDIITFGLVLFAAGSLLGFMATEYWMIITGRILQSVGASVIPAIAMIIPVRYFPPETRGRALGVTSAGIALGMAIGPVFAGFVTSMASWRYLFLVSVLVIVTLPFYRKYLDDYRGQAGKTDLLGGSMLALTLAFMLLGITNGAWLFFVIGAAMLVLFIWHINRASNPFIMPSLFKNRNYSVSVFVSFIGSGLSFGIPFLIPQMLTQLNGLSSAVIGLVMFPGALIAALLSRRGGRLADKKGNVFVVVISVSLHFISFILLSSTAGIQPSVLWIFLVFGNIGGAFLGIGLSNIVSRTLPKEQTGAGMGLLTMFNFIAGAVATSSIGKLLDVFADAAPLNPLLFTSEAAVFSNIFLALSGIMLLTAAIFLAQFGRKGRAEH